jgi:Domain of unknown function (DUF6265)
MHLSLLLTVVAASPACPAATGLASVQSLAWMAGAWQADDQGLLTEEHWMAPNGGAMLAASRTVKAGKMVEFEFLRIEEVGGKLLYRAQPGGRPLTDFTRVEQGPSCITFENPEHAFPRRILYWREGGALHARIEGTRGGKPAAMEWTWTPSAPSGR